MAPTSSMGHRFHGHHSSASAPQFAYVFLETSDQGSWESPRCVSELRSSALSSHTKPQIHVLFVRSHRKIVIFKVPRSNVNPSAFPLIILWLDACAAVRTDGVDGRPNLLQLGVATGGAFVRCSFVLGLKKAG